MNLSCNHCALLNFTTEKEDSRLLEWSVVTCVLSLLGALANILVLLAVRPHANHQSSFAILLTHYILIEFVMCFSGPTVVFLVQAKVTGTRLPSTVCAYLQTIFSVSSGILNWSDAGLACNRCIALFFPHQYSEWSTKRVNVGLISGAWIISLLAYVAPSLKFGFAKMMIGTTMGYCTYWPSPAGTWGQFVSVFTTIVPYAISGVGACLIVYKSWRLTHDRFSARVRSSISDRRSLSLQYRLKLARMLLLTFLWTALCVTPPYVVRSHFPQILMREDYRSLWFRITTVFQAGFIPCIILLSNHEYRRRLTVVFGYSTAAVPRSLKSASKQRSADKKRCSDNLELTSTGFNANL